MHPSELLAQALSRLAGYGFLPVFGAEIESYVQLGARDVEQLNGFFAPVLEAARAASIPLLRIEEEKGPMQFELVLGTFTNAGACAEAVAALKAMVEAQGKALAVPVSFAAKPIADAPGSGLHLHLNLMHSGENAFHKTDDYISDALYYALGGLCAITPHVMPLLCPSEAGFRRYSDKDFVARTASWGSNNRSCAVRIPYTPAWEDKRLEWRVPAADADPHVVAALMLHAIACGIDERMVPPAQSYGIATKEADMRQLPLSLEEALQEMELLPTSFAPLDASILRGWLAA